MWQDLLTALCLVCVLEGIMPFIAPRRWRQMLTLAAQMDERSIRLLGLALMLAGAGALYLVR